MINYKRGLLSLATIMALSTAGVQANYIPLTDTADKEEIWSLFGVSGLKTDGAGAGTSAGTFSITDNTANAVTDATQDELFVEGFLEGVNSLGKVKVLAPYTSVEVRIDTTGVTYDETEPVRTMYVTMTEGDGPSFAVTYKASLEGQTMQYSIMTDGSNAHTITIDSANTYNNPGFGAVIQEIAGIDGSALSSLSDAVDYDFSNNPSSVAYYDKDTDQNTAGTDEYLRAYTYDATNEKWDLYDSRNTDDANDFLELEKGKAYWAKMNNPANKVGGLVLGSASVGATEYTDNGIIDGWNLIAFDKNNPDIRKSSTGLLVELVANTDLDIYDASGNHKVTATIVGGDNNASMVINQAIAQSKIDGKMPRTFDLKAFPTGTAGTVALISNKRFMIVDSGAGTVDSVTTLTGAFPYTLTDKTDLVQTTDVNVTDLDDTGTAAAMSKYNEYAMIIEPLVGDAGGAAPFDTAASMGGAKVHVQSAASDATVATPVAISSNATAATALTATTASINGLDIGGYTTTAYEIDTDYDGVTDKILVASTEPFYVRDYTFTRTFAYTDDVNTSGQTTVSGIGTDATYADAGVQTAAVFAAGLGATSADINATEDSAGTNIVITTSSTDANEFQVTENTSSTIEFDQLADTTIADDVAKGAIKGVYSLDSFAERDVETSISVTILAANFQDDVNDTIQFNLENTYGSTHNGTVTLIIDDVIATSVASYAVEIQAILESEFSAANIPATITPDVNATRIIFDITSTDLADINYTTGGTEQEADLAWGASTTVTGKLVASSADLSNDLKFNAVYTPNYVIDGPLYTMKEAGYTMKAMVTGTTDLSDGTVNWDSIDLSRKPSEWLDSQDYNLFKIDETSGYWVYLEGGAAGNPLGLANPSFRPNYTHHFNINGTNYNHVSGNLEIEVTGMDEYDNRDSAVVSSYVAGSNIELARSGTSNIYTGKLSSYELKEMGTGFEYEIFANIADGLGYNLKSEDTTLLVDYKKPAAPVVDLGDGTSVAITSTSDDAIGFYVFDTEIPEESTTTATELVAKLDIAEAAAYSLCEKLSKKLWDADLYTLKVIAVDGTGTLGKGNASDTTTTSYLPMLKDSIRLEDSNAGDSDATILGTVYDGTCTDTGAQEINYGVTLTSETDLQTVKMAYEPKNVSDLTAVPITVFVNAVSEDASVIAKITFADIYVGETVYIELQGIVYSYKLPAVAEEGIDIANPLDLSNVANNARVQADQSL